MAIINNLMNYSWWIKNPVAALSAAVILFFYAFLALTTINIPFNDDYASFFRFLHFFNEDGWWWVYKQHNEHRIVSFRLLVLLNHYLSHSVNIVPYILLGNLGLIGIAALLYRSFNIKENKPLYFLPVILLLFVPVLKMHNFGMATFVNIIVILLSYLSLYFLNKEGIKSFMLAVVLAVLAVFTVGAGIFVFPTGVVLLVLFGFRWKRLIAWLGIAAAGLSVYFIDYRTPKRHGSVLDNILENFDQIVLYSFGFVGSSFKSLFQSEPSIIVVGMFIVIFAVWMVIKKWSYFKANPLLLTYLVFLVLLIGASAVSRGYRGYDAAFENRYQLMHVLVTGLIFLMAMEAFPKNSKRIIKGIVGLSLLLYVVRMADYVPKIMAHNEQLESSLLAYWAGRTDDVNSLPLKFPPVAVELFDMAFADETYVAPDYMLPKPVLCDNKKQEATEKAGISLDVYEDTEKGLVIHGRAFIHGHKKRAASQKVYIVLKSDAANYLIPARKFRHYEPRSVRILMKQENMRMPGPPKPNFPPDSAFSFILPKEKVDLPKGEYQLSILVEQNSGTKALRRFNKTVVF